MRAISDVDHVVATPRAVRAGLPAPTRPYGFVVRDFSTEHDPGFAWMHVPGCELLRRQTVHDEAWWRGRCDGIDLIATQHVSYVAEADIAEQAHRAQFDVDFPIRRHSCVAQHEEWLAGLVTLPQLAAELRLDDADMGHLWARFLDATHDPGRMWVNRRRAGHWLVDPQLADAIRRHVAAHPDEYDRVPAPDRHPTPTRSAPRDPQSHRPVRAALGQP